MHSVIIIDDDPAPMAFYIKAFQDSGFNVKHITTVREAIHDIETAVVPPDAYVLDIMMPPGDELPLEQSNYGLTSGIEIYKRIRAKYQNIPIVVLTNVSAPHILAQLPISDVFLKTIAKIDTLPFALINIVEDMYAHKGTAQ